VGEVDLAKGVAMGVIGSQMSTAVQNSRMGFGELSTVKIAS
jgi:hypothetical protein